MSETSGLHLPDNAFLCGVGYYNIIMVMLCELPVHKRLSNIYSLIQSVKFKKIDDNF